MKLPRRNFLHLAAGAATLPALSRIAWAQAYPTRLLNSMLTYDLQCTTDVLMAQTANTSAQADPLEQACLLVGRFQYHFGRIEQKIDHGVIKLFDLDENAGPIVTGSLDFAKKLNLVRTAASQQAGNAKDRKFGEDTCKGVFDINDVRQLVIHSSFEPTSSGDVQFRRTVAKDGRVRVHDQVWGEKEFNKQYAKINKLADDLAGC